MQRGVKMSKTIISKDGRFEWEEEKYQLNIANHNIKFEDVFHIFDDFFVLEEYDKSHSIYEDRYKIYGFHGNSAVVCVCNTDRSNRIRIISAYETDKSEREKFYEHIRKISK
jgi:uncharacterized DUF497 family protein